MTLPAGPSVIAGDEALATFRQGLTGPRAFELLDQAHGRLLVQQPVGVGKSRWLQNIITYALTVDQSHDLLVVLVPRWDILREIRNQLPASISRVVLSPRPRRRCGDLDEPWLEYERHGCGFLGRELLCGTCPVQATCRWPGQYGRRLRGARLILGTQQHLALNPQFLVQLCHRVRASNPLLLIDESDLLIRGNERTIAAQDLERFIVAQEAALVVATEPTASARTWLEMSELFGLAPTLDLREGHWIFPWVDAAWATEVQRHGHRLFGTAFRFLAYELHHFARSDVCSRERLPNGGVRFAVLPYLGERFIIFSGSIARELARYRLDPNHSRPALVSPFEHLRFEHPETRWYNLSSLEGAAKFFPGNASRIMDFFAGLIARNIQAGRRTLLVSRKKFVRRCQVYLRRRLIELGVGQVRVVTGNWDRHDLQDPCTVALITYGVTGVNRFQHCEAAYCLNSYYVSAATVAAAIQDIDPSTDRYPVTIQITADPPRRQACVSLPDSRETILPRVAQWALEQKEADVVVQAVGRVRPFTRPREVITFHAGVLPGVRYRLEFRSLTQARPFFGLVTPTVENRASRAEQARRWRALGWSLSQIAAQQGVSRSTVKRDLGR